MLSDEEIKKAKRNTSYSMADRYHEHDDCIRIAYEWLDAQKKTKYPTRKFSDFKHLIEKWAGRYVSGSDVDVAAHLHPDIYGKYPYFNISTQYTEPSTDRLKNISQAFKQEEYRKDHDESKYKFHE